MITTIYYDEFYYCHFGDKIIVGDRVVCPTQKEKKNTTKYGFKIDYRYTPQIVEYTSAYEITGIIKKIYGVLEDYTLCEFISMDTETAGDLYSGVIVEMELISVTKFDEDYNEKIDDLIEDIKEQLRNNNYEDVVIKSKELIKYGCEIKDFGYAYLADALYGLEKYEDAIQVCNIRLTYSQKNSYTSFTSIDCKAKCMKKLGIKQNKIDIIKSPYKRLKREDEDTCLIQKAIVFATQKHEGQTRKGTDIPYIVHPMEVMHILTELQCSQDVVIAGILHDVLEDTATTPEEIKKKFGSDILKIVQSESEDKSKSWLERKQKTIDELEFASEEICLVLYADKLSNLRSMYNDELEIGNDLWSRFNTSKEDQGWYYKSLGEVLFKKLHIDFDEYNELLACLF